MTDTRPVYTAHDTSDLLNALPTLFGFRPEESLVAVATQGPRRRFGFRLRVDVPPPELVEDLARTVVTHLHHHGADGAIVIAVTERQDVARDLLDAIEDELLDHDIQVVVCARADGRRYWSDEPGFPAEGIAYETSDHHLSIVHAVAAGQEILPDRQALVDRFRPVAGPRRTWLLHATLTAFEVAEPLMLRAPAGELGAAGIAEVRPILDRGLAGERLTDDDVVRLAVWVWWVPVRDAVWALIDRDNAQDVLRVLAEVSRSAVPPCEPAVLSLTAFAAWLTGDGAQALIAVERALAADPGYSMARIVLELLERGVSPALWTPFEADAADSP